MSTREKEGGPAFPTRDNEFTQIESDGMTLRDYFAAAALTGELASYSTDACAEATAEAAVKAGLSAEDFIARTCFKMADAMLKARNQQN